MTCTSQQHKRRMTTALCIEIFLSDPLAVSEKNPLISLWDLSCHKTETITERTLRSWKKSSMQKQNTIIAVRHSDFSLNSWGFYKKRWWEGGSAHNIVQKRSALTLHLVLLHWALLTYLQKQARRSWPRESNINNKPH